MRLLALPFRLLARTGKEGLVLPVLQIRSLVSLQNLVGRLCHVAIPVLLGEFSQHLIQQSLGHIVGLAVRGRHLAVGLVGIYAESHVAGQRPGRGGPCQEVGILAHSLKANHRRAFLYQLVSLGHLLGGQRRSAAGAVGNNLKSLVEKLLLPDFLQRPPLGLNIIILIGHIGMLHICPETDRSGEILPHALIFPYGFLALLDEGLDAVLLNLILSVEAEKLLHLQLHRQSVGIPSGLPGHIFSLHGLVAGNHILDDTGQHMADMGLAIGRGRSVIEGVGLTAFPVFHTLLENMILFPEILCGFLSLHKIHVRGNFFVHFSFSFPDHVSTWRLTELFAPPERFFPMMGTRSSACGTLAPSAVALATYYCFARVRILRSFVFHRNAVSYEIQKAPAA